uniref:Uncharacterized protein n=1 Tax=Anguilla anguilla TaxID=7936 RepID=A0A0E9X658_ANGAN
MRLNFFYTGKKKKIKMAISRRTEGLKLLTLNFTLMRRFEKKEKVTRPVANTKKLERLRAEDVSKRMKP